MMAGAEQPRTIERVAVIGAGTMGWQIAALTAASGRGVQLFDADPAAAARGIERLRAELPGARAESLLGIPLPDDVEQIVRRITVSRSMAEAVEQADLVIEAVREEITIKRTVFAQIDPLAPGAILATNSSSLPSSELIPAVADPSRLLNLHFFSPVWRRPMLEVMGCGQSSAGTLAAGVAFGRSLGLVTAEVRGESKGFIINRVWRAVKREVLRVVDEGHADPEDVDRLWMLFFGTSTGPFGIMDGVGLDVVADIEASYAAVSTDPTEQPSTRLHQLIDQGKLGEKSGEGFYRYPNPAYARPGWLRGANAPDAGGDEHDGIALRGCGS